MRGSLYYFVVVIFAIVAGAGLEHYGGAADSWSVATFVITVFILLEVLDV